MVGLGLIQQTQAAASTAHGYQNLAAQSTFALSPFPMSVAGVGSSSSTSPNHWTSVLFVYAPFQIEPGKYPIHWSAYHPYQLPSTMTHPM
jgi:hypothetical protein